MTPGANHFFFVQREYQRFGKGVTLQHAPFDTSTDIVTTFRIPYPHNVFPLQKHRTAMKLDILCHVSEINAKGFIFVLVLQKDKETLSQELAFPVVSEERVAVS